MTDRCSACGVAYEWAALCLLGFQLDPPVGILELRNCGSCDTSLSRETDEVAVLALFDGWAGKRVVDKAVLSAVKVLVAVSKGERQIGRGPMTSSDDGALFHCPHGRTLNERYLLCLCDKESAERLPYSPFTQFAGPRKLRGT